MLLLHIKSILFNFGSFCDCNFSFALLQKEYNDCVNPPAGRSQNTRGSDKSWMSPHVSFLSFNSLWRLILDKNQKQFADLTWSDLINKDLLSLSYILCPHVDDFFIYSLEYCCLSFLHNCHRLSSTLIELSGDINLNLCY